MPFHQISFNGAKEIWPNLISIIIVSLGSKCQNKYVVLQGYLGRKVCTLRSCRGNPTVQRRRKVQRSGGATTNRFSRYLCFYFFYICREGGMASLKDISRKVFFIIPTLLMPLLGNDLFLQMTFYYQLKWVARNKMPVHQLIHDFLQPLKGQLISKAIYGILDSPKKRTKKI